MAGCIARLSSSIPRFSSCIVRSNSLTVPVLRKKRIQRKLCHLQQFSTALPTQKKETVVISFVDRDGDLIDTTAAVGSTFLDVALDNDVEVEAVQYQRNWVTVYFVQEDGTKSPAKAKVGDNLLDIVIENDIDIDGYGACEGTLACSTCHLIFQKADYDKIEEKPTDEELDMLDLAYGLTDTSRLGCQVIVTKEMDGLVVRVPAGVADARDPS